LGSSELQYFFKIIVDSGILKQLTNHWTKFNASEWRRTAAGNLFQCLFSALFAARIN